MQRHASRWACCCRRFDVVLRPSQVMVEVKALTKLHITVVATVHSPTPYCYTLFDRLMIILCGRVVYFGDRGASRPSQHTLMTCLCGVFLRRHLLELPFALAAMAGVAVSISLKTACCSIKSAPWNERRCLRLRRIESCAILQTAVC